MKKIVKTTVKFDERMIIKSITDDKITFSDDSFIDFHHSADCCEYNCADFKSLKDTVLEDMIFKEISLEKSDYGFLLNGHLVNCYSYQNGYYSSDVDIYYREKNGKVLIHLNTECNLIEN